MVHTVRARYLSGDIVRFEDCPTINTLKVRVANLGDRFAPDVCVLTMANAMLEDDDEVPPSDVMIVLRHSEQPYDEITWCTAMIAHAIAEDAVGLARAVERCSAENPDSARANAPEPCDADNTVVAAPHTAVAEHNDVTTVDPMGATTTSPIETTTTTPMDADDADDAADATVIAADSPTTTNRDHNATFLGADYKGTTTIDPTNADMSKAEKHNDRTTIDPVECTIPGSAAASHIVSTPPRSSSSRYGNWCAGRILWEDADPGHGKGQKKKIWEDLNSRTIQMLLDARADPNYHWHGVPVLFCAASKGDEKVVGMLLRASANVDGRDHFGLSALMHACAYMWEAGAGNSSSSDTLAVKYRKYEAVVRRLCDMRANVNYAVPDVVAGERSSEAGMTALMYAARARSGQAIRDLISARADVNQRDARRASALMIAVGVDWQTDRVWTHNWPPQQDAGEPGNGQRPHNDNMAGGRKGAAGGKGNGGGKGPGGGKKGAFGKGGPYEGKRHADGKAVERAAVPVAGSRAGGGNAAEEDSVVQDVNMAESASTAEGGTPAAEWHVDEDENMVEGAGAVEGRVVVEGENVGKDAVEQEPRVENEGLGDKEVVTEEEELVQREDMVGSESDVEVFAAADDAPQDGNGFPPHVGEQGGFGHEGAFGGNGAFGENGLFGGGGQFGATFTHVFDGNAAFGENGPLGGKGVFGKGVFNGNDAFGENGLFGAAFAQAFNGNATFGQKGQFGEKGPGVEGKGVFGKGVFNGNDVFGENGPFGGKGPLGAAFAQAFDGNAAFGQNGHFVGKGRFDGNAAFGGGGEGVFEMEGFVEMDGALGGDDAPAEGGHGPADEVHRVPPLFGDDGIFGPRGLLGAEGPFAQKGPFGRKGPLACATQFAQPRRPCLEVVRALLEGNARVGQNDTSGKTALEYARAHGTDSECYRLLLRARTMEMCEDVPLVPATPDAATAAPAAAASIASDAAAQDAHAPVDGTPRQIEESPCTIS